MIKIEYPESKYIKYECHAGRNRYRPHPFGVFHKDNYGGFSFSYVDLDKKISDWMDSHKIYYSISIGISLSERPSKGFYHNGNLYIDFIDPNDEIFFKLTWL